MTNFGGQQVSAASFAAADTDIESSSDTPSANWTAIPAFPTISAIPGLTRTTPTAGKFMVLASIDVETKAAYPASLILLFIYANGSLVPTPFYGVTQAANVSGTYYPNANRRTITVPGLTGTMGAGQTIDVRATYIGGNQADNVIGTESYLTIFGVGP